jgi:acyl dehydratase
MDPREPASAWRSHDLGTRTVRYDDREAILYALAVGAAATDLDLVFEERLRVLPTFALTRGQWAPEALGDAGAFDATNTLHGAQRLRVRAPLPKEGELEVTARVAEVWDKGSAAVFEIVVECACFEATWSLFAPGRGGFGGDRGPSAGGRPDGPPDLEFTVATSPRQAALYRLLGDRHHLHIDPEAARAAGMPRPILHGLCTLATVALPLAGRTGAHPADLVALDGRFTAPVFPGDRLQVSGWRAGEAVLFEAAVEGTTVVAGGRAQFRVTT